MDSFGENVKKLLLAGIGAVAVTAEKSKDLLDEMVEKGELTVEQNTIQDCGRLLLYSADIILQKASRRKS